MPESRSHGAPEYYSRTGFGSDPVRTSVEEDLLSVLESYMWVIPAAKSSLRYVPTWAHIDYKGQRAVESMLALDCPA